MSAQIIFEPPKPKAPEQRYAWSGWKATGPLEDWRDDAPESLPRCTVCQASIRVGDRYALSYPFAVACLACARLDASAAGSPAAGGRAPKTPDSYPPRHCERCGQRFVVTTNNRTKRYCTRRCAGLAAEARRRAGMAS